MIEEDDEEDLLEPEERLQRLAERCRECQEKGKLAPLITLRVESLAVARLCYGKSDPESLQAQCDLADAYMQSGLYRQAVEHAFNALTAAQDFTLEGIMEASSHICGKSLTQLKKFSEAKKHLREALRLVQRRNGRTSEKNCTVLSSIAQLHALEGENGKVVETMKRIWSLREPVLGKDHIDMVDTYLELARAFFNAKDDSNCQDNLNRVLRIVRKSEQVILVDDESLKDRLVLTQEKPPPKPERDDFEFDDDELAGALPKEERPIHKVALPPLKMSWKVADAMCLNAASLKRSGFCERAVKQYESAKTLYALLNLAETEMANKRAVEVARVKVCKIERELATIYIILTKYTEAAERMLQVLQIQDLILSGGRFDVHAARTLQRIGEIYCLNKQFAKSKTFFRQALSILSAVAGPKSRGVSLLKNRLSTVEGILEEGTEGDEHDWAFGFDYDNDEHEGKREEGGRSGSGGYSPQGYGVTKDYSGNSSAGFSRDGSLSATPRSSSPRKTVAQELQQEAPAARESPRKEASPRKKAASPAKKDDGDDFDWGQYDDLDVGAFD